MTAEIQNAEQVTDQEVNEQVTTEEVKEPTDAEKAKIKEVSDGMNSRNAKLDERALNLIQISAMNCDAMWKHMLESLLGRLGNTQENIDYLTNLTADAQYIMKNLSTNAIQLADMHNYFINGGVPIDMGAKFVMDDYMRGVLNFGFGVLPAAFNIIDPDAPGANDPRWGYDMLPTEKVIAGLGKVKIPMRIETYTDIFYGTLELFEYQTQMSNGRIVTFQTTHPAIRVGKNWVTCNSIVRWMECGEDVVKNAWLTGKGSYAKKAVADEPDTNPIANPNTASVENETNG